MTQSPAEFAPAPDKFKLWEFKPGVPLTDAEKKAPPRKPRVRAA